MVAPLIEARGLGKRFPGVIALRDVDLRIDAGEVVAVIGENGAGKSTLMKILAGVHEPDLGELRVDGELVRIDSVRRATELGIVLIHQELELCDNLSAGANVMLGREPRGVLGLMRPAAVDAAAAASLQRVGLRIPPSTPLEALSIGQRQLVEVAKALSQRARLLIMDEPTSSLSFEEAERLFGVIDDLRREGVAIVYISHRLAEVARVADRVVGLRDGRNSGELPRGRIEPAAMLRMMIGRDLEPRARRSGPTDGRVRLSVRGLRTEAWPEHAIDLQLRAGEIVGLAGLIGAGRSELLETLFGARSPASAVELRVDDAVVPPGDLRSAVVAGLALVPEDRKRHGAVLGMAIRENVTLASLPAHRGGLGSSLGWLDRAREVRTASAAIEQLDVRCAGAEQRVVELSGGNQQKVVLAKWLARDCGVLLLDEPTRGVDVAAKAEIHQRVIALADRGLAVLFASSDLAEILAFADRILVLHEGRLAGELRGEDATEEAVMTLATAAVDGPAIGGSD